MDWTQCIAEAARSAAGHRDDEPGDLPRLLHMAGVEVQRPPGRGAGLLLGPGVACIEIGDEWQDEEMVERLWHELSHWLIIRDGHGNPKPAYGGNHHRLRRLWDAREEAQCDRVARLLRLPVVLLLRIEDDGELADCADCSTAYVQECRRELLR